MDPCGSPENAGCKRLIFLPNSLIGTDLGRHMDIKHKRVTRGWLLDAPVWLHGPRSGIMSMSITNSRQYCLGLKSDPKAKSCRAGGFWNIGGWLCFWKVRNWSGLYWFWQGFDVSLAALTFIRSLLLAKRFWVFLGPPVPTLTPIRLCKVTWWTRIQFQSIWDHFLHPDSK
jgi:hypothetical protein